MSSSAWTNDLHSREADPHVRRQATGGAIYGYLFEYLIILIFYLQFTHSFFLIIIFVIFLTASSSPPLVSPRLSTNCPPPSTPFPSSSGCPPSSWSCSASASRPNYCWPPIWTTRKGKGGGRRNGKGFEINFCWNLQNIDEIKIIIMIKIWHNFNFSILANNVLLKL
jgi:hypothetical protein